MNTKHFFGQALLFAAIGIVAGLVALVTSSVIGLFLPVQEGYFTIFILVLVEEFSKLGGLAFLTMSDETLVLAEGWRLLFLPVFFGIGFGAFELALIYLNVGSVPREAFDVAYIHITTSLFLFLAIYVMKIKGKELLAYAFILLAVLIHLCYNVFVVSIKN